MTLEEAKIAEDFEKNIKPIILIFQQNDYTDLYPNETAELRRRFASGFTNQNHTWEHVS
jgi:hypothetical protein